MKSVVIKRATTGGISACYGELYEYAGFQFCITDNIDNDMLYAIEVSMGLSAHCICVSKYSSKRACTNALKRWIREHATFFNASLVERSKKLLFEYNYKFPLNKRK